MSFQTQVLFNIHTYETCASEVCVPLLKVHNTNILQFQKVNKDIVKVMHVNQTISIYEHI